jgi:hypothetical protein
MSASLMVGRDSLQSPVQPHFPGYGVGIETLYYVFLFIHLDLAIEHNEAQAESSEQSATYTTQ